MLQRLIRFLAAFSMVILIGSAAVGQEPQRPSQDISHAAFADGRLWLLTDAGDLWSIAEGKDESVAIDLPEPAHGLWIQDGQPAVITCDRDDCREWTLRSRRRNGEWAVTARVATGGEALVSAISAGSMVVLLTTRRLVNVVGDKQSAVAFSQPLRGRGVITTHVTTTSVFVGLNRGEFGGGLQRIDRKTGDVTAIESNESGDLCGGPLNAECDPVTGIETIPWKPDCVAVAIGLSHFLTHGSIVEVCDDRVRRLYSKPRTSRLDPRVESSVPFYGLIRRNETLWAVGIDEIYEIEPDGTVRSAPPPAFKQAGEFIVSFDLPHVVLVVGNVPSVGGGIPILVPR
jgi:hypothetical protein